jgi:acetyl-CoA carboxylase biotin carboxyl carrier protein
MELTHDDVLEILGLLEGSDVDYLELDVGGTRLVAHRNGLRAPAPRTVPDDSRARADGSVAPQPSPAGEVTTGTAVPTDAAVQPSSAAPGPPVSEPGDGDVVTVTAPVVGVFYRSPEPGAPPFTEVGAEVAEDSTVGLVEVMKMFNSVTAGVRGHVVEILAENDAFVEYGQALMTIRPETVQ